MPLGVIELSFDPVLRLSETSSVRYETIAVAAVLLLGLLVAARIAAITPAGSAGDAGDPATTLRIDDLVFIAVGAVPGAILGGRAGYVLGHLEFYRANPGAVTDLAQGGLTLSLAVPFGVVTAALVARLLGAPVGHWMHAAAAPLLFVLAGGKLAGVLGATGQGALADVEWATSYLGPGPWGSLAPEVPAHPSQAYEAIAVAAAIPVLALASRLRFFARRDGAALFLALGLWAAARVAVAETWRDPAVVGPLRMDQALALGLLGIALTALVVLGVVARRGIVSHDTDRSIAPDRASHEVPAP